MSGHLDRTGVMDTRTYLDREDFKFKNGRAVYAEILCPFHGDTRPSMLIYFDTGRFQCQACGARGRDLIAFHQLRTGTDFRRAFTDLGGRIVKRSRK